MLAAVLIFRAWATCGNRCIYKIPCPDRLTTSRTRCMQLISNFTNLVGRSKYILVRIIE